MNEEKKIRELSPNTNNVLMSDTLKDLNIDLDEKINNKPLASLLFKQRTFSKDDDLSNPKIVAISGFLTSVSYDCNDKAYELELDCLLEDYVFIMNSTQDFSFCFSEFALSYSEEHLIKKSFNLVITGVRANSFGTNGVVNTLVRIEVKDNSYSV